MEPSISSTTSSPRRRLGGVMRTTRSENSPARVQYSRRDSAHRLAEDLLHREAVEHGLERLALADHEAGGRAVQRPSCGR